MLVFTWILIDTQNIGLEQVFVILLVAQSIYKGVYHIVGITMVCDI